MTTKPSCAFTNSVLCMNTRDNGESILAIHRMVGNKVALSIGVKESGDVVINDKCNKTTIEHRCTSKEAREIKALVREEYQNSGHTIPAKFLLALTL